MKTMQIRKIMTLFLIGMCAVSVVQTGQNRHFENLDLRNRHIASEETASAMKGVTDVGTDLAAVGAVGATVAVGVLGSFMANMSKARVLTAESKVAVAALEKAKLPGVLGAIAVLAGTTYLGFKAYSAYSDIKDAQAKYKADVKAVELKAFSENQKATADNNDRFELASDAVGALSSTRGSISGEKELARRIQERRREKNAPSVEGDDVNDLF